MRVFVAGATGAIGRPLVERLIAEGHHVTGTTRTEDGADLLRAAGAVPAVLDMSELGLMTDVLFGADPDVVINQVTSLPKVAEPEALAEGVAATSKLRRELYPRLAQATAAAGAHRLIVQSTAFSPTDGSDIRDVIESSALNAKDIDAVILRYGYLYGPGTWFEERPEPGSAPFVTADAELLNVDDAVEATVLAVTETPPGVYTVTEASPRGRAS